MDMLWSASTTMRNPERALNFLSTIAEMDGEVWNDESQMKLQALLIKNRFYLPTAQNLNDRQLHILSDLSYSMTYNEARDIFDSKQYVAASMRGRTSFDPIEKLGLVCLEAGPLQTKVIKITDFGQKFLNNEITLSDVVLTSLLKFQYPNPLVSGFNNYNTKPFINTLRLIKKVNELCAERGLKVKGLSRDEFGIFALSLKSYDRVDSVAEEVLSFRAKSEAITNSNNRKIFTENFIKNYLSTFQKPVQNCQEYSDNMIRYLRLTNYIFIHGGGYYIDLEPRRMVEINAILDKDNGAALAFKNEMDYVKYMGDYDAYVLPFETKDKLKEIRRLLVDEVNKMEVELHLPQVTVVSTTIDKEKLKDQIDNLRTRKAYLNNLFIKRDYAAIDKIDDAIQHLENIRSLELAPSIALEKWANVALNIINDAKLIKPNSPLGDDNEPIFTAPAKVPDIECYYDDFGAICEVTMLSGRDQWFNEGQPVMRHLRDFESKYPDQENYCLFIAPKLHQDTLNTFWISVKYEYDGKKQKIVPITISQLIKILKVVKGVKVSGSNIDRHHMINLYNKCVEVNRVSTFTEWQELIKNSIEAWEKQLVG